MHKQVEHAVRKGVELACAKRRSEGALIAWDVAGLIRKLVHLHLALPGVELMAASAQLVWALRALPSLHWHTTISNGVGEPARASSDGSAPRSTGRSGNLIRGAAEDKVTRTRCGLLGVLRQRARGGVQAIKHHSEMHGEARSEDLKPARAGVKAQHGGQGRWRWAGAERASQLFESMLWARSHDTLHCLKRGGIGSRTLHGAGEVDCHCGSKDCWPNLTRWQGGRRAIGRGS
mmetsp:Transcript_7695/g.20097  ORF Transcript_7695/g.20097 Transcript_7695/m.20097 type:complete len:233 (+) Transcript_7695:1309-2007(+)